MTALQLRQDVLDELEFEPSVDAAHIGVMAEGGVVTLSGYVKTYLEKLSAISAARRGQGRQGDRGRNRRSRAERQEDRRR
ncbi:osmotically-inducible protein OsmY [Bradyrhizobium elkanii]